MSSDTNTENWTAFHWDSNNTLRRFFGSHGMLPSAGKR